MAVWSLINKENLEGCDRLDPEYYQPCYLAIESILQQANAVFVSDVAACKHRKFKPIFNKIFKYIEISEINTVTGESKPVEILGQNAPSRAQRIVKEGDVIVSTVRPNRNAVSLINREQNGFVCSTGFTVLKAKEIAPEYLFTYLKTKYSINQLERKTTASMYPAINENDILKSLFFKAGDEFQKKVKKLIIEFTKCLQESKLLYSQAEQILLEELGLKDLDLKDDLFYTTTLKEVRDNNRMDAEYYIQKYEELIAYIRNYKNGYCGLFDIAQNITTNYDPLKEGEHFRYIELSNIQASIGVIENAKRLRTEDAPSRAKRKLKKGDVIVSSIKGSLDKTAMVVSDFDGAFASNGFFQFRAKSVNPAYLILLIKSDIVYLQLFREASGAILSAVPKESLKNIIIPKLDKNIQEEISKLVQNAHEKYHKSKLLFEEAKYKIEEMIEKEAGIK
jgi:restriction endonuclease S subunit